MSAWTNFRDAAEGGAVAAGNYFLPGSAALTSRLVSDGAKQALQSNIGQLALLGGGIAGGMAGNMGNYSGLSDFFTTNPASAVDYQNGADVGGAGSSPNNTGSMSDMATANGNNTATPALLPNTVSSGSNISDYGTAGGAGNYGYDMGSGSNVTGMPANATTANMPDNIDVGGGFNPAAGATAAQTNPGFLNSLMSGNIGDAASAAGNGIMNNKIATIYGAGSLYDMYAKNQMAKKQQSMYDQNRADIMGMYAPGSAEYNSLMNEMARKDAAAGRNSQYGARAVDLAGKIANYKTTALANMQTGQNALANQGMGNQFGMMNTPLTLAALTATQKQPITG